MKYIKILYGAILSGICIGIGSTIYLSLDNKIVGSLLFATGLYAICVNGLYLYTGKIGYLLQERLQYIPTLITTFFGNFLGTELAAVAIYAAKPSLRQIAYNICQLKINNNLFSLFILGIFCGILMFIAVDGYKNTQNPLIIFVCISTFILCGFQHCIADMYYFWLAGMFSWGFRSLAAISSVALGNTAGALLIPAYKEFLND